MKSPLAPLFLRGDEQVTCPGAHPNVGELERDDAGELESDDAALLEFEERFTQLPSDGAGEAALCPLITNT